MPTPAELKAQIDALTAQYAEAMKAPPPPATTPVKLDLGCGPNKQPGHIGVDERQFPGVDVVCNLGNDRWPWADESVDEVHCAHMVEHLTPPQRIHFTNELFRVLKHGGKATIITPHWCSHRAYGDLTHQWPPVSEMWFGYLNAAWRKANAPHNDTYTCDFEYPVAIGYQPSPWLQAECASRNPEFVQKQTQEALDGRTTHRSNGLPGDARGLGDALEGRIAGREGNPLLLVGEGREVHRPLHR